MITTFSALVRKFMMANKARAAFSILGIVLSTALMISVSNLMHQLSVSYEKEIKTTYGAMDMMMGVNRIAYEFIDSPKADKIISTKGITDHSKVLLSTEINISTVHKETFEGVYTIGTDNGTLSKSRYKFKENLREGEVILTRGMADDLHINVSDTIKLGYGKNFSKEFKVIAIADDARGVIRMNAIILNIQSLQDLLGVGNSYSLLLLESDKNMNIENIATELKSMDGTLRVDVVNEYDDIQMNIRQIEAMGYGLGVLAMFVGILFVFSNFRLFIYEYQREVAIMRAVGGNAYQSFKLIMVQALIFIIAGCCVGLVGAYLLNHFVAGAIAEFLGITIESLSFHWLMALKILAISSVGMFVILTIPAFKSMKILPIEVMRENERTNFKEGKLRKWVTMLLLLLGLALIIYGRLSQGNPGADSFFGGLMGGLCVVAGVFAGASYFIKILLGVLSPVFNIFGGRVSYIAVKNIAAQTRKNLLIVLTLAGALTIAITGISFLKTIEENQAVQIKNEYITDYVLALSRGAKQSFMKDIVNKLKDIKGIETVIPYSFAWGGDISAVSHRELREKIQCQLTFVDVDNLSKLGFLPQIGDVKNSALVTPEYAAELNLRAGDIIYVTRNFSDSKVSLEVVMIDKVPGENSSKGLLVDWSNTELGHTVERLRKILINIDETRQKDVESSLNQLKADYPGLSWSSQAEMSEITARMIQQRYALLIIAVVIILMIGIAGIITTLNSHIQAHRMEYVILRAVSLSPGQLFKMILSQCVLYCLIGTVIGTFTGVVMVLTMSIGIGEPIYLDYKITVYAAVGIHLLGLILVIPMARKVCRKSIAEELVSVAK